MTTKTHTSQQRPDWARALSALIEDHNEYHASRKKIVAHGTQAERRQSLFRCFRLMRSLGFKLDDPANIGGRHIKLLVRYWTADTTLFAELQRRSGKAPRCAALRSPLSPAYIQQQLSFLRVFSGWIGKPGLVLPAEHYVSDKSLVQRTIMAARDRSWDGNDVDPTELIAGLQLVDARTALLLEVMLAFGLRRKEALMLQPAHAMVPAHALPAGLEPGTHVAFLRVKRGTKGGRLRYTALRSDAQALVLARARECAGNGHLGYPGLTLKQSLDRFSNTLKRAGITRARLGVTGHGLRHQFAADLYYEIAEVAAPVRGGPLLDSAAMNAAYLEVARQLGHGRPQISGAYLGKRG